ncbi:DUF4113 domain-containing protein [Methylobacterium sp. WCS2018Hpa-22]|uniref:DUF4113 domain-containing protein n=1 Tax=Methylobacterium sp. WCS2018Hpa-22 TaxID=3073633 RepID=UPI00288C2881|nr:DUF4113 domain-containing protein [Methylobacterium sp. WCS2018Hpa-22]
MTAMDECNRCFGRGAIVPAQAGLEKKRTWSTKFEMRRPRYTTRVSELPTARAYRLFAQIGTAPIGRPGTFRKYRVRAKRMKSG